jgi:hypothetical protein
MSDGHGLPHPLYQIIPRAALNEQHHRFFASQLSFLKSLLYIVIEAARRCRWLNCPVPINRIRR